MRFCPSLRLALKAMAVCLCFGGDARAGVVTMVDNGASSNRVDVVFLGDGYTAPQIDTAYVDHIENMLDHMFAGREDPFPRYRNFFNVHRVNVVSDHSGADVPPEGVFRDTALDGRYSFNGGPQRLLYVDESAADAALGHGLAGADFSAEMKLVTVNDTRFGGGGGSWAVYAGGNGDAPELALHELGHSFSQLADQYVTFGGRHPGGEPSQPNVTKSPSGEKWARWLGYADPDHPEMGAIGAYEGADHYRDGVYRPSEDSKMRSLGRPFDAIAREKIILDIYSFVDPLDAWLDSTTALVDPDSLWVDVVDPEVIQVQWSVDGMLLDGAAGGSFHPERLGPGSYAITAYAYDDTPWVRIGTDRLDQSVTWSVTVTPEPTTWALLVSGLLAVCLALWRRGHP